MRVQDVHAHNRRCIQDPQVFGPHNGGESNDFYTGHNAIFILTTIIRILKSYLYKLVNKSCLLRYHLRMMAAIHILIDGLHTIDLSCNARRVMIALFVDVWVHPLHASLSLPSSEAIIVLLILIPQLGRSIHFDNWERNSSRANLLSFTQPQFSSHSPLATHHWLHCNRKPQHNMFIISATCNLISRN